MYSSSSDSHDLPIGWLFAVMIKADERPDVVTTKLGPLANVTRVFAAPRPGSCSAQFEQAKPCNEPSEQPRSSPNLGVAIAQGLFDAAEDSDQWLRAALGEQKDPRFHPVGDCYNCKSSQDA